MSNKPSLDIKFIAFIISLIIVLIIKAIIDHFS